MQGILGSPEVITPPQDIPITAVIMEWIYLTDDGSYPKMWPKDKVEELTKLYLSNGYTPFLVKDDRRELTKLDTRKFGVEWQWNWKTNVASYLIQSLYFIEPHIKT